VKVGDLVQIKISDDIYKPNWLQDKIGVLIGYSQRPATLEEIIQSGTKIVEPAWKVLIEGGRYVIAENDLRALNESR